MNGASLDSSSLSCQSLFSLLVTSLCSGLLSGPSMWPHVSCGEAETHSKHSVAHKYFAVLQQSDASLAKKEKYPKSFMP